MAFTNLGFETEDPAALGQAQTWAATTVATAVELAGYGDASPVAAGLLPFETFDGDWDNNDEFEFELQNDAVFASYDAETVEDFDEGWNSNESASFTMGSIEDSIFEGRPIARSSPGPFSSSAGRFIRTYWDIYTLNTTVIAATPGFNLAAGVVPAYIISPATETVGVLINDAPMVSVVFTPAQTTPAEARDLIIDAIDDAGLSAQVTVTLSGGTTLRFDSLRDGYGSRVELFNVTHLDTWQRLGFNVAQVGTGGSTEGTGNVKFVDAILAEDIAAIVAGTVDYAATGFYVTVEPDQSMILHGPVGSSFELNSAFGILAGECGFEPLDVEIFADYAAATVEDFENDWGPYLSDWNDVLTIGSGSSDAMFNGATDAVESFDESWDSNEAYAFTMGTIDFASFDSGGTPELFEDFEETKSEFVVSADLTGNFTAVSHGLSLDSPVMFKNVGGELPAGISPGYVYYVAGSVTTNTFRISSTVGGTLIELTSAGIGTHRVIPDKSRWWVDSATTI
jgi:hypothetical protein